MHGCCVYCNFADENRGPAHGRTRKDTFCQKVWTLLWTLRLSLDRISRNRFHFQSTSGLLFLCTVPTSGWINKNGKYKCSGHQSRNEIKGLIVVSIDLSQISEQQRSKGGGKCPWQHHQAENGAHVSGPKIIGRERRGNAISAPIAHHQDECNNS